MERRALLFSAAGTALCLTGCAGAQRAMGGRPAVPSWSRSVYEQPHGTIYWGGAGLDGPYVEGKLQALRDAGVDNVSAGQVDTARRNFPQIGMFLDALRAGTSLREEDAGDWVLAPPPQATSGAFNLIGYSYGSLIAAQTAASHARHGFTVDHVVLIGSPIGPGLLAALRSHPRIGQVLVVDLAEHGDPMRAGMPQGELTQATPLLVRQMLARRGEGHFHYAVEGDTGRQRWAALAARLRDAGLR
jgi:pimeloyl-ACP methyl ester carboxylesterase